MEFPIRYEVYDKITKKSVIVDVTEEDLLERYGKIIEPTRIFIKDLACRRGLHSWNRYNNLVPRRLK